jgi:hypothetical protein
VHDWMTWLEHRKREFLAGKAEPVAR